MALNLCDYEKRAHAAVQHILKARTGAKNGLAYLFAEVATANGLPSKAITMRGPLLTLPGFFRPTNTWDLVVMHEGQLIAALGIKSAVERDPYACIAEAISDAVDLTAQHRRGAWQHTPRPPFIGFVFVAPDALVDDVDTRCGDLIQQRICDSAAALSERTPLTQRFGELVSNFAGRCAAAATLHSLRVAS